MSYNLPSAERVRALLQAIAANAADLENGVPALGRKAETFSIFDLLQRCNEDDPGYPPSSGLEGAAAGRGTHPDPVMQMATVGDPGSPHDLFEALLAELEGAKRRTDMAVTRLRDARPVPQPKAGPRGPRGCRSCARLPKNWTPLYEKREKDDLCRKCWEWWKAHDEALPPLGVIEAWRDGRRLTNKIINDAFAAETSRRRKGKKRRRVSARS